jgi:hypothetical protein
VGLVAGAEALEALIGVMAIPLPCGRSLALKLKDVKTEIIEEDNATYAAACSALGVYSVGKTLKEAKRNFQQALDLHLSVLRFLRN